MPRAPMPRPLPPWLFDPAASARAEALPTETPPGELVRAYEDCEILSPPPIAANDLVALAGADLLVAATSRRWSGLDVYTIGPDFTGQANSFVQIRISALVAGLKTLVAVGTVPFGSLAPRLSARYRGAPELLQVEVRAISGAASTQIPFQVVAVARNDAQNSPDEGELGFFATQSATGSQRLIGTAKWAALGSNAPTSLLARDLQLLQISGYNANVATRYVHLFDQLTGPIADPGGIPQYVIPVAPGAAFAWPPRPLGWHSRFANGLRIGISTTGPTFTGAADGDVYYSTTCK